MLESQKKEIESLEIYIEDIKGLLKKAELRYEKEIEEANSKLVIFYKDFMSKEQVIESYNNGNLSEEKMNYYIELFESIDDVKNKKTPIARYIKLLNDSLFMATYERNKLIEELERYNNRSI